MKNTVRTTVITLALVVMALSPAYAQKTTSAVNIPFKFTVDDTRMPAGEYIISSPSERVVDLQHVGGPEAKNTMTNNGSSTKSDGRAKLVFHKYGNTYFLAAAWLPNSDHARPLLPSAPQLTATATEAESVMVGTEVETLSCLSSGR